MPTPNLIGRRVLFLGAHCDDLEIGCGGTAAKLVAAQQTVAFAVATDCGAVRKAEATAAAALLGLSAAQGTLFFSPIPDGRLEERKDVLRNWLRHLLESFQPDTVFVHRGDDTHPDHAALYQAATAVFVKQTLFLYAIPKLASLATPFVPNYYEDISDFLKSKLRLCACHASQADKGIYLDPEHLTALARVAYQSGFGRTGGAAESFHLHVARSGAEAEPATVAPHLPSPKTPPAPAPASAPKPPPTPGKRKSTQRKKKTTAGSVTMNIGAVTGQVIGKMIIKGDQNNYF